MVKHLKTVALALAVALVSFSAPAMAQSDHIVYFSNGAVLSVPAESWEIAAMPKGFNTASYEESFNPKGRLPGWGGWPEYEGDCDDLVLGPGDQRCERQPYFVSGPTQPAQPSEPPDPGEDCSDGDGLGSR